VECLGVFDPRVLVVLAVVIALAVLVLGEELVVLVVAVE
jgi:hypothetical protein